MLIAEKSTHNSAEFAQKKNQTTLVCKNQYIGLTSGYISHITILSMNVQGNAFLEMGY